MLKNRRVVILVVFIIGVVVCFWLVSRYPALGEKAAMSGAGAFDDPMTHQAHFHAPDKAPLHTRVFYTTFNWYETNWRGMAVRVDSRWRIFDSVVLSAETNLG